MSITETKLLQRFIDDTIKEFGHVLWIERQVSDIRKGVPDVYALMDGIFLPIEAKYSFEGKDSILSHKFKPLQVEKLKRFWNRGAYACGIVFRNGEVRYVLPDAIREDGQMSLEQFRSLPTFTWKGVVSAGKERRSLFV